MKEKLIEEMKTALADSFAFSLKAQYYHWNVEGINFYQFHELFGEIYSEVHGAIDTLAELIRTLKSYTPGSLQRFKELTSINEDIVIPSGVEMAKRLLSENDKVLACLLRAYQTAEDEGELGVSNFLQDRIQAHEKHSWFLRATTKEV
jgi:starvation-inducible DNA-binding protein